MGICFFVCTKRSGRAQSQELKINCEKIFKKLLTKRYECDKILRTIKQNILRSHLTAEARWVDIQVLAVRRGLFARGIFVPAFFCAYAKRTQDIRRLWRLHDGGVFNISAKEMTINEDIKAKEVRVIGPEGETLGVMPLDAALNAAYDQGYDLVLMAPQAVPPVCRIMDYGKYRFERDKKEKEAKKKQQTIELKEIQLSCRIDTHDFETKLRHAKRFLTEGNKVRVVMRFKGREMSHVSIGQEIMKKFQEDCSELGNVDKAPVLDGRFMSMVITPLKFKAN